MLNCQHHVSWVREVDGGLHQCILCTAVVTKKDVTPKLEDLPEEFGRRWDAHEATRPVEASAVKPPAAKTATARSTATPTATATATGTPSVARTPPAPRTPAPPIPPADPHPAS